MVSMNGEEETVISEVISAIVASLILHSFFIFCAFLSFALMWRGGLCVISSFLLLFIS